ncbi:MAG: hypothetical protein U1F46_09800 [Marinagarivorans sp.]
MKFPDFLSGPGFNDGNLVHFECEDVEFSCRLPIIPNYEQRLDALTAKRDFSKYDTSDWHDGGDCWLYELSRQSWKYEDAISHDDIAISGLTLTLILDKPEANIGNARFNPEEQKKYFVQWFNQNYGANCGYRGERGDYNVAFIGGGVPIGIKLQSPPEIAQLITPKMMAYITLNKDLYLMISFSLDSLHYDNRKNPYSEELLHQLKIDLFDEFLSFIQVTYSGEVLNLVEQQAIA